MRTSRLGLLAISAIAIANQRLMTLKKLSLIHLPMSKMTHMTAKTMTRLAIPAVAVAVVAAVAESQVRSQALTAKTQPTPIPMIPRKAIQKTTLLMIHQPKALPRRAAAAIAASPVVLTMEMNPAPFAVPLASKLRSSAAVKVAKQVAVAHQF
jgi:hypothetical protein